MSRENLEMVRRTYAEWERGNMSAGVDLFAPGIVFESFMPDSSERVVAHGRDEVKAFMGEWLGQWRDYRLFGEEFLEVGEEKILVAGRQTATGRHSGVAVEDSISSLWTFREGKVIHLLFERGRDTALQAAGLTE